MAHTQRRVRPVGAPQRSRWRVKAPRRMKQPMTLVLETSPGARDPVARALGQRGLRGAEAHISKAGALQALLRQEDWDE